MRKILVTGGTGFIGSALVRALVGRGDQVRSLDNDSRGSRDALKDLAGKVEFQVGDIRDYSAVAKASRGMDIVCHLAAINGTRYFYEMPEKVLKVGVLGVINVLEWFKNNKKGK